jgi:hypothetical protein
VRRTRRASRLPASSAASSRASAVAQPNPNPLATVKRAAASKRRADARHEAALEAYRAALLDAVDELADEGRRDAFTVVAKAAGITRQALHQLAGREALR